MAVLAFPLGKETLSGEELQKDKKGCLTAGPCGVGEKALYLGSRFVSRWYYIPWSEVSRVYKRVAMSPGGFSGKGVFGSMSYLVVEYPGGTKQCYVKHERDVDAILEWIADHKPSIPIFSEEGARRLAEAEEKERARYLDTLPEEGEGALKRLKKAKTFVENKRSYGRALTDAAKQKRITDQMPPALRLMGGAVAILGALAVIAGIVLLLSGQQMGWYFALGGGALFFMMLSANLLPSKHNSPRLANEAWEKAVADMEKYLADYPSIFPTPAQYAHPVVLERMIRLIREGRATSEEEAYEEMKKDLKALNSQVKVSQKEYDEVVQIKPLFLVCDYRDSYRG